MCVLWTPNSESAVINQLIDQLIQDHMSVDTVCVCVCFSTVSADKLDKHLKKCNSRQKPTPVRHTPLIDY